MAGDVERGVAAHANELTRVRDASPCRHIRRRPLWHCLRCWMPVLLTGIILVAGVMGARAQTIVTNGRTGYGVLTFDTYCGVTGKAVAACRLDYSQSNPGKGRPQEVVARCRNVWSNRLLCLARSRRPDLLDC